MPLKRQPGAQPDHSAPGSALDSSIGLGIPADYGTSRGLPLQVEATQRVSIGTNPEGRDIQLTPEASVAWAWMKDAASIDGVTLVAVSGFRSIDRQSEIIRAKLSSGQAIEEILRTVAAPGYSEHHTGRAIDIGTPGEEPLTEAFADTPAFRWLQANAGGFGFKLSYPRGNPHGISYEPWHWCFRSMD
jgi:zinc D-Ala-D-Ala carboxypeptidase